MASIKNNKLSFYEYKTLNIANIKSTEEFFTTTFLTKTDMLVLYNILILDELDIKDGISFTDFYMKLLKCDECENISEADCKRALESLRTKRILRKIRSKYVIGTLADHVYETYERVVAFETIANVMKRFGIEGV